MKHTDVDTLTAQIEAAGYRVALRPWVEDSRSPGLLGQIAGRTDHNRREVIVGTHQQTDAEIARRLAHELNHVRRPDWDCGSRSPLDSRPAEQRRSPRQIAAEHGIPLPPPGANQNRIDLLTRRGFTEEQGLAEEGRVMKSVCLDCGQPTYLTHNLHPAADEDHPPRLRKQARHEPNRCIAGLASDEAEQVLAAAMRSALAEWGCETCSGEGWYAETTADPLPSGEPGEPYQIQVACAHECNAGRVLAVMREHFEASGVRG